MIEPMPKIEPSKPCCYVFTKIFKRFEWMRYEHQQDMMTVPHFDTLGNKWRVNFCPSCGKDIRNINWRVEDL